MLAQRFCQEKQEDKAANLAQDTYESDSEHVVLMGVANDIRKKGRVGSTDRCDDYMLISATTQHAKSRNNNGERVSHAKGMQHATMDTNAEYDMLLWNKIVDAENDMCWYLDIGCSNHMTVRREWLVDPYPRKKSSVRFAEDSTVTTEGVGRVLAREAERCVVEDVGVRVCMWNGFQTRVITIGAWHGCILLNCVICEYGGMKFGWKKY